MAAGNILAIPQNMNRQIYKDRKYIALLPRAWGKQEEGLWS